MWSRGPVILASRRERTELAGYRGLPLQWHSVLSLCQVLERLAVVDQSRALVTLLDLKLRLLVSSTRFFDAALPPFTILE